MAKGIERVGETGLGMTLEFPDAKMRDDFEIAVRGWIKQYQQAEATRRLVGALAQKADQAGDDDDTTGHLIPAFNITRDIRTYYIDFLSGI